MKTASEVVQYFENLYNNKAVYVYGANAQIITKELCDSLYLKYGSEQYNQKYYNDKFIEGAGRIGADCSGAFYPVSGWDGTAQVYYNRCTQKGSINLINKSVPCLVFKGKDTSSINHVGFYCGNGYVIEMMSSKENCKKRTLEAGKWNYFGIPAWIDYGSASIAYGIDVSSFQGTIDFNAVKKAGYQFVIIRTVLKNGKFDDKFEENLAKAELAGMKIGVYIMSYALTSMEAVTSAQKIINALGGNKYPIFLDLEADGHQMEKIGKAGIANISKAFMQTCQQYGFPFYIYCNLDWYRNVIDASLKPYAIWIARYGRNDGKYDPTYKPNVGEKIWQYSSQAVIPGIKGNVDVNACYDMGIFGGEGSVTPVTPTPTVTTEKINVIGVVTGNDVNLRQAPNTDSAIIKKYNKGNYIQLIGKMSNGWYKTNEGYISGKYVKYLEGKVANCNKVNVRMLASKLSPSVKVVPAGTEFYVIVGQGEWFNVLLKDNTVGWIKKDYVELLG